MSKPLVYVSGPLTQGDRASNINRAEAATFALIRAGFSVICPHSSARNAEAWTIPHDAWIEQDKPIIRRCDALYRLEGLSPGSDEEWAFASLNGIPAYHEYELADLIADRDELISQGDDDDPEL